MMATNVGKSNTMITTDAEMQRESSGNVCRLRTLLLRCYRGLKLPLVFEPNAMRKEEGRFRWEGVGDTVTEANNPTSW